MRTMILDHGAMTAFCQQIQTDETLFTYSFFKNMFLYSSYTVFLRRYCVLTFYLANSLYSLASSGLTTLHWRYMILMLMIELYETLANLLHSMTSELFGKICGTYGTSRNLYETLPSGKSSGTLWNFTLGVTERNNYVIYHAACDWLVIVTRRRITASIVHGSAIGCASHVTAAVWTVTLSNHPCKLPTFSSRLPAFSPVSWLGHIEQCMSDDRKPTSEPCQIW